MEISYWQGRWRKDKTGWHMNKVFLPLKTFWPYLRLKPGDTVLVPLCGKSLDIDWLAEQGHHVIGVEVSERALQELMSRLPASFHPSAKGPFTCYKSPSIELWCGDILKIKKEWLPPIDAIYDKAALIALPGEMRSRYATHIQALIHSHSQIFINCFEYEQQEMPGPPFAVFEEELRAYFGDHFTLDCLHSHSLFDELTNFQRRGLHSYLKEKVYHLYLK